MNKIKLFIGEKEVQLTEKDIEEIREKYSSYVKNPLFRRIHNEPYFYITSDGFVERAVDFHYNEDGMRYDVANYCTNRDIMVGRAKSEVLSRLLWKFSMENGWYDIPWDVGSAYKYYLAYNHYAGEWEIRKVRIINTFGTVYFVSNEIAQRALDEIIIPFEREELEICQIWDDYDDDK